MATQTDEDLRSLMRRPDYGRLGVAGDRLRAQVRAAFAERYPGPLERDATGRQVDGAVHVRSYERRGDDGRLHTVQAHERGAPPRGATPQAWIGQSNQSWREQIAAEETGRLGGDFGYNMRGQTGSSALGRYQLLRDPLVDAGWKDRNGNWTVRARSAGVTTDEQFLANPAAQEAALSDVMARNERQLAANGASSFIGRDLPGLRDGNVTVTEAGLAAAAHREGARAVRRYLEHRAGNNPIPTSIPGQRGDLSRFNEIERRLRAFEQTPYEARR